MAIKPLGPAALLLASLAGCGGGGAASAPPAADPAAAVEDSGSKTAAAKPGAVAQAHAPKIDPSLIPEPGTPIVRETYSYAGGSRDPFASVLDAPGVGPELADLDLVMVVYQERGNGSVAVFRDRISLKRYTVREGERLGRARVSTIGAKDVTFTIDDYGTERQVVLTLRKQEGSKP